MLLVGVAAAYFEPATGYELSLYAETPLLYFVGFGIALLSSVWLSFVGADSDLLRDGALLLGSLAVASLVVLPLIRGYYLYVGGDSLTHLGWTRELLGGSLEPTGLLYPGIHMMTIFVSEVIGIRLGLAQMVVVFAFVFLFVVFVTLCVRLLGSQRWAVPVGLFAGLLLLPVNNISVHVQAHAITQSLLFLPFALYLVLRYVDRAGEWTNPFTSVTQNGLLLSMASLSMVLIHPQGALNLILIMVTVAGIQYLFRRYRENRSINAHRPIYAPAAIAAVAFVAWSARYDRVRSAAVGLLEGIISSAPAGDEITQRSASLADLGGSIELLFVKLFLVALVFCLLAGLLTLAWGSGRLDDRIPGRNALLTYLIVAAIPLLALFGLFFLSSANTMHFRYLGFIMVVVTALGALAINEGADRLTNSLSRRSVGIGLVVLFLLCLPLPMATMHSGPFIYQSSSSVSEMHYEGTNQTFENMDRNISFAGIRSGPQRLVDAQFGTERAKTIAFGGEGSETAIPFEVWGNNLSTHYDSPRYVQVDESDYQREVVLYNGFRYGQRGFETLETTPSINRVQSSGEYQLYFLESESGG
ncbi:hypothetical protein [Salinibaculum salinum]|uniref:hypothetical protein n=1 Tax=Salinibaculum salinum TaxID=3131996 RepID=UPI0030EC272D